MVVVLKPGFLSPQAGCEFFRSPGKLLCCWSNHREGKSLLQSTWELSEEAGSQRRCVRPRGLTAKKKCLEPNLDFQRHSREVFGFGPHVLLLGATVTRVIE